MKKVILLLLTILLLPIMVYAEDKKVILESISLNGKSDNVVEVSPATMEDNKVILDFKMYEVDDYIEYKIKVKNNSNETLEIDNSSVTSPVKYVKYSVDSTSKIIKSGEEKDIILKIAYQNKVEDGEFVSAKYTSTNKIPLVFKSPSIINPKTIRNILPLLLVISLVIGYSAYSIKKNKTKKSIMLFLVAISMMIPFIVFATSEEIIIELNLTIGKIKPTHCTFGGELVPGAEYTNGQYTYRYRQERILDDNWNLDWQDIDNDGWGVTLTDKTSTDPVTTPLCSIIDDKPLVSTNFMFSDNTGPAQTTSIDTSTFDTSNVTNMEGMFYNTSNLTSLDVSNFDTSNVINMYFMFYNTSNLTSLDVSNFDTSSVTNMNGMFQGCDSLVSLDVSNFDTNKVIDMSGMFYYCKSLVTLDLSNFDTSKVINMSSMFADCSNLTSINVSNFDTSSVTNMMGMFRYCWSLVTLDLSSFDISNVNISSMFAGCDSLTNAYGRTQADCDRLNDSYGKPSNVNFVIKP